MSGRAVIRMKIDADGGSSSVSTMRFALRDKRTGLIDDHDAAPLERPVGRGSTTSAPDRSDGPVVARLQHDDVRMNGTAMRSCLAFPACITSAK
jgi:hypothetical protein